MYQIGQSGQPHHYSGNPARAGLKLEVIQPNLNYVQARAVEQAAMAYYHTINTANKMNN